MNKTVKTILPLAILFFAIELAIVGFQPQLRQRGFDTNVLHGANILFFLLSIISFFIQLRGFRHPNTNVFVRSVTAAMMLKILVCIIVTFIYVSVSGTDYNKQSVFAGLLLYLVYLPAEVIIITKMNKTKNA